SVINTVAGHWSRQWNGTKPRPRVERIFEVMLPRDSRARNTSYRCEDGGSFELQTYHSSQCICDLGVNDAILCDWKSCGICNIIKSSFHAFAFGVAQNSGRYGLGIYSYENPALADRFSTSSTSSPFRVMVVCEVAIANLNGDTSQSRGLTAKGVVDEELVFVSDPAAITPSYIVLYR
ncbi:hypothetical protein JAAARDRAFT_133588, partial [Jaapia argillacea MUCL 33604]